MQVSVENVGNLGRKLTVRIPAARLEDTVRNRVQEMGRSARLKGFRPGKVPTKVIEQRFGAQIRGEALSELIGSSFQEAINTETSAISSNDLAELGVDVHWLKNERLAMTCECPLISASKGLPASRHVQVSRSSACRKPSCRNWMTPFLPRSA